MLLVLVLATAVGAADTPEFTGNTWLSMCHDVSGPVSELSAESGFCIVYVSGLRTAIWYYETHIAELVFADTVVHANYLASVGALPPNVQATLKGDDSPLKGVSSWLLEKQADAMAHGAVPYLDGLENMTLASTIKPLVCVPETVTNMQLLLVFNKYLRDHPESLHKHVGVLFFEALPAAFPCKAQVEPAK